MMLGIMFGMLLAMIVLKLVGLATCSWILIGVCFVIYIVMFLLAALLAEMDN